jgi:hypothetical protein
LQEPWYCMGLWLGAVCVLYLALGFC